MPKTNTSTTIGKKTSTRKTKDPHAPKRYRTAYILFSIEKRDEIKNDNPGLSSKEILSELGAQWKAVDAATKQRFQKLSDMEKVEYEEKMIAYRSEKDEKENPKKKKSPKQDQISKDEHEDSMED